MNDSRDDLIKELAADLRPVTRPGDTRLAFGLWLTCAAFYSVAVVLATGDLEAGALAALVTKPAFALEAAAALAVIVLLGHATLRSAIPDARAWPRRLALPLMAIGIWIGVYVVGLAQSAEPIAIPAPGERKHCFWQVLLFSVPSLALLLSLARGLLPLWPRATAALAGAAAAAIPAALMQLACTDEPLHSLAYHITPIALSAALGAAVGRAALRRRLAVPRTRRVPTH